MKVKKFEPTDADLWNQFISAGKNSTFLFHRNFIGYHNERFSDYSLMIFDDNDHIVSVVPANITSDGVVISHQGLTYGAFVLKHEEKLIPTISIIHSVLKFLHENGITTFNIKSIPSFYNPHNSEELDYIFFLLNAELYRRDTALVIDKERKIPYSGNIRREADRAQKMSPEIIEENELNNFWNMILAPNLREKYGVSPVHTLEEIQLLKTYFPNNIRQFSVYLDGSIVAGTTLFVTDIVAHCQYISANETGRKSGALNFLFRYLIDEFFSDYRYFDFGIVNENAGRDVNKGLLFWKESFGGRAQLHDFYTIRTSAYSMLEKFIA